MGSVYYALMSIMDVPYVDNSYFEQFNKKSKRYSTAINFASTLQINVKLNNKCSFLLKLWGKQHI